MAQGSSSRTVKIGDQPVSVEDVDVKDLLIALLNELQELKETVQLIVNGGS
jgi:hypothetical protein